MWSIKALTLTNTMTSKSERPSAVSGRTQNSDFQYFFPSLLLSIQKQNQISKSKSNFIFIFKTKIPFHFYFQVPKAKRNYSPLLFPSFPFTFRFVSFFYFKFQKQREKEVNYTLGGLVNLYFNFSFHFSKPFPGRRERSLSS